MAVARDHGGARVPAKPNTAMANKWPLEHLRARVVLAVPQDWAMKAGKVVLTGDLPFSGRQRPEEEDDGELGAAVVGLAQERLKRVAVLMVVLCVIGIGQRMMDGDEIIRRRSSSGGGPKWREEDEEGPRRDIYSNY